MPAYERHRLEWIFEERDIRPWGFKPRPWFPSDDEVLSLWRKGNDAGEGFAVGEEGYDIDEIDGIGDYLYTAEDIAVYQDGDTLVGVADANGPWAVKLS